MSRPDEPDGFYEHDEPIEKISATFESGAKGVTVPPRGINVPGVPGVPEPVTVGVSPNVTWEWM